MSLPTWLKQSEELTLPKPGPACWKRFRHGEVSRNRLERWLALACYEPSEQMALLWLRERDGRAKCLVFLAWLFIVAFAQKWEVLALIWTCLLSLWFGLGLSRAKIYSRLGPAMLFVTFTLLPAFWLSPLSSVVLIFLRSLTSLTLVAVLFETTTWPELIASARRLGMPDLFAAVLDMTYRYIWTFLRRLQEALQGRESRQVGRLPYKQKIAWLGRVAAWLFHQTDKWAQEISDSMICRGYEGQVFWAGPGKWTKSDYVLIAFALLCGILLQGAQHAF